MQNAGHRPIALLGGGTTMIGDPSGKSDMRNVMTKEFIDHNASKFKLQFEKFLDFSPGKAIMENNADWLLDLNYLDFMREIGVHFSVNRMLTFDCYKNRLSQKLMQQESWLSRRRKCWRACARIPLPLEPNRATWPMQSWTEQMQ